MVMYLGVGAVHWNALRLWAKKRWPDRPLLGDYYAMCTILGLIWPALPPLLFFFAYGRFVVGDLDITAESANKKE